MLCTTFCVVLYVLTDSEICNIKHITCRLYMYYMYSSSHLRPLISHAYPHLLNVHIANYQLNNLQS